MNYSAGAPPTVTDLITTLVHKLLAAEDPEELRQLREQLNQAIHERREELRKGIRAFPVAGLRKSGGPEDQGKQ